MPHLLEQPAERTSQPQGGKPRRHPAGWGHRQDQVLNNITHDLRAPLCAIMGYLDLVGRQMEKSASPKAAEYLSLAREAGERMHRMMNDMLEMFRVENGDSLLRKEPLSLSLFLHNVRNTFAGIADLKNIRLHCAAPEKTSTWADPRYLGRVFDNLVSNALKFTPDGGSVHLRASRDAGRILFEVADTGRGIPPENQKRIFEKFQHVQPSDRHRGYGMGLAVVKAIVKAHGGDIRVDSQGRGSRFIFWIPDAPLPQA